MMVPKTCPHWQQEIAACKICGAKVLEDRDSIASGARLAKTAFLFVAIVASVMVAEPIREQDHALSQMAYEEIVMEWLTLKASGGSRGDVLESALRKRGLTRSNFQLSAAHFGDTARILAFRRQLMPASALIGAYDLWLFGEGMGNPCRQGNHHHDSGVRE